MTAAMNISQLRVVTRQNQLRTEIYFSTQTCSVVKIKSFVMAVPFHCLIISNLRRQKEERNTRNKGGRNKKKLKKLEMT